jgi:hypothetical protein
MKMGDWSRMDRKIHDAEQAELSRMGAKEEMLEFYFEAKRRKELSKKNIKDMSWDEVHEVNELTKSNVDESTHPDQKNVRVEILNILDECIVVSRKNRPELVQDFQKLKILISQFQNTNDGSTNTSSEREEEISSEPEVSVSKSMNIQKSADGMIISGFATSDVLDSQNSVLPIHVLKQALPAFLAHGIIMLRHGNRPVARVIHHDFRKTDSGHNGLFIRAKLFDDCEDIAEQIGKTLTGFSIGGHGTLVDHCDRAKCWKDIDTLKLYEISLVEKPACSECCFTDVN